MEPPLLHQLLESFDRLPARGRLQSIIGLDEGIPRSRKIIDSINKASKLRVTSQALLDAGQVLRRWQARLWPAHDERW